eukprot:429250-Hanusia_phi.AAC.2
MGQDVDKSLQRSTGCGALGKGRRLNQTMSLEKRSMISRLIVRRRPRMETLDELVEKMNGEEVQCLTPGETAVAYTSPAD